MADGIQPGHELAAYRHKLWARDCIAVAKFFRLGGEPYNQNSGLMLWSFGEAIDAASRHIHSAIEHLLALRRERQMAPTQYDGTQFDGVSYVNPKRPSRPYYVALPRAEVRVAQASDGRWMWGISFTCNTGGMGYAPLEKWGKFATSRDEALNAGAQEMLGELLTGWQDSKKQTTTIVAWLQSLLAQREPKQMELFA